MPQASVADENIAAEDASAPVAKPTPTVKNQQERVKQLWGLLCHLEKTRHEKADHQTVYDTIKKQDLIDYIAEQSNQESATWKKRWEKPKDPSLRAVLQHVKRWATNAARAGQTPARAEVAAAAWEPEPHQVPFPTSSTGEERSSLPETVQEEAVDDNTVAPEPAKIVASLEQDFQGLVSRSTNLNAQSTLQEEELSSGEKTVENGPATSSSSKAKGKERATGQEERLEMATKAECDRQSKRTSTRLPSTVSPTTQPIHLPDSEGLEKWLQWWAKKHHERERARVAQAWRIASGQGGQLETAPKGKSNGQRKLPSTKSTQTFHLSDSEGFEAWLQWWAKRHHEKKRELARLA